MSILFMLLLLVVATVVPTLTCFWLARADARQSRRALALRTLSVSTLLTAVIASAVLVLLIYLMRSTTSNVYFGVNWIAIGIVLVMIYAWASATGAIGYSIGMRLFWKSSPEGNYGGEQPVQRLDESGNPYQPPST